ncbi:hypothetical protein CBM2606_A150101 [Cupriavidus taiwanensis]|nr:hypothetical protein CBM2606_A150101 [Cupriavidus taiwanensis]
MRFHGNNKSSQSEMEWGILC